MNKKKVLTVLTLICLLLVLTGCSQDLTPISDATTFDDMLNNGGGIFGAILIYPLAKGINFFANKLGVFWGIVIITVIINAILLAATFKSNLAMQKMQLMQPEQQKIQKKYEGRNDQASQQRMTQELQALYKKYDVNPMGALLVSFLQFPILIAMYNAIRRSTYVSEGTFMGATLAQTPKEAFMDKAWPLLVIYVLMIVTQMFSVLLPQILAKAKAKKDADLHHKHYEPPQAANPAMTYGMVIFIGFIMLSWPCALSLYYMIVSVVNIVKTLVLNVLTSKQM